MVAPLPKGIIWKKNMFETINKNIFFTNIFYRYLNKWFENNNCQKLRALPQ